jgi:hypothetical protein
MAAPNRAGNSPLPTTRRRAGSRMRGSACTLGPERHWGIGALGHWGIGQCGRHALRSLASTSDTRCQRQPPALVSPRPEDMMMATAEAKGEHVLGSRCHLALDALGERPGLGPGPSGPSGPVSAACRLRAALSGFLRCLALHTRHHSPGP